MTRDKGSETTASEGTAGPLIRPDAIAPGQTIGIVCPASGVMTKELSDFIALCQRWNVKVKLGANVSKRYGYLAAPDEERARELMDFVNDPTVDAIVCGRGGYGVMRILPMLDFQAIRAAGKIIMGFSDITALLIAVQQLSGLVTFHGPVASSTFDAFTTTAMTDVVLQAPTKTERRSAAFSDPQIRVLSPGLARGRLTGGNLAMIVSTLGTRYEIDTNGAILFLEEINEEPYRIDRMLTQLWLAGKLQQCAGIALGNFRDCEAKGTSRSEPSFPLQQVIQDRISSLKVPAVYGLPFGHVKSKLVLPLGIRAELDADSRSLRLLDDAVTYA